MNLNDDIQAANARKKLEQLETPHGNESAEPGDEELREASMRSVQRLINQLKEEIARYEAHRLTSATRN